MANIVVAIATVFYVVLTAAVVLFMWLQTTREREAIRLQMYHLNYAHTSASPGGAD